MELLTPQINFWLLFKDLGNFACINGLFLAIFATFRSQLLYHLAELSPLA